MDFVHAYSMWQTYHADRCDLLNLIEDTKRAVNHCDGPRRKELKAQIARLGKAIEYVRNLSPNEPIDPVLVEAIQFANRERAENRMWVKHHANQLKNLKQRLRKMNQFLSSIEASAHG